MLDGTPDGGRGLSEPDPRPAQRKLRIMSARCAGFVSIPLIIPIKDFSREAAKSAKRKV